MPSHYHDKETMKTEKSTRKSQPTTHGNHKAQKHKAFIESPLLLRLWREKAKGISRGGGRHGWHTIVLQSHQAQLWLAWTEWLHHADRRKDGREGGRMANKQQSHEEKKPNHWDDKWDKNFSFRITVTDSSLRKKIWRKACMIVLDMEQMFKGEYASLWLKRLLFKIDSNNFLVWSNSHNTSYLAIEMQLFTNRSFKFQSFIIKYSIWPIDHFHLSLKKYVSVIPL